MFDERELQKLRHRGMRLRWLRREILHMTVAEFALLCDRNNFVIGAWEQARISGLTPKSARLIVGALEKTTVQCSDVWLLYGRGLGPSLRA